MKLLFDENLRPRLVANLTGEFPDSLHVRDIGLERAMDEDIWGFARDNGFVIVSKDSDFHQLSFLFGHPPKVIWTRRGNCSTAAVVSLRRNTPFHLSWVHSLGRRPLQSILQQVEVVLNGEPNVLQI